MPRKYRQYSEDELRRAIAKSRSFGEALKRLGLRAAGGNYATLKRKVQELKLSCGHFLGQGWSREQRLKDWSKYNSSRNIKGHLIALRGRACEKCKSTEWLFQPIPLETHHIDGDRTNNDYSNLQLLCPNCHSLTDNFRNKKRACGAVGETHRT